LNGPVKKFNMKINIQEIKAMVVSRDGGVRINITIDEHIIYYVKASNA
jgi:hypothetical protein